MLKETLKGGLSALMISIGGSVFLACENRYVGAALFSVALFTICLMQFNLYTGKIGFMVNSHKKEDFKALLFGLLGNFLGCIIFGLLIRVGIPSIAKTAEIVSSAKLEQIRAFFCGVLMYVAVWSYREKSSVIGIFVCIPVFILSGFEHSIADMFYLSAGGFFNFNALLYIFLIVIGNSVGGMFIPAVQKLVNYKKAGGKNE